MNKKAKWPALLGLALCALALLLSGLQQYTGYLSYLDSDSATELLLGREQAKTLSLIQMDWLYSTEIRILGANLLYALAFLFGATCRWARIIGNLLGLVVMMAACVYALRRARVPLGAALCAASLLGVSLGQTYVYTTVVGAYLLHGAFGFLSAGLWLAATEGGKGRKKSLLLALAFMALCALMGFLSVRYVLCFICPMMAVAVLDVLLAPSVSYLLRDSHMRFACVTAAGFAACVTGYAAAEFLLPKLFTSGVGAASSFLFNPMDAAQMARTFGFIVQDFLYLLGWRGGVELFSAAGLLNMCISGTVLLGGMMLVRVYRGLGMQDGAQRRQKRLMQFAFSALLVNLFCFLMIKGTYLARYLVLAVLPLLPAMAIAVCRERSQRLKEAFLLLLAAQVALGSALMLSDTKAKEDIVREASAPKMEAAQALVDMGYTHGYGTFWEIRVLEERTEGALTFTGVRPNETEPGAVTPVAPQMIRWLEADHVSHMDACPGKTFLLLTPAEREQFAPWLTWTGAPVIYENSAYIAYGFDSSEDFVTKMLLGSMKLENAVCTDDAFVLQKGARMRVPTDFREAGDYGLTFDCEGTPVAGSVVEIYAGNQFTMIAQAELAEGGNALFFSLPYDDKYFMILFRGGEADNLAVSGIKLSKEVRTHEGT